MDMQDSTTEFLGYINDSRFESDSGKHIYVGQGECAHVDLRNEPEAGLRLSSHAATTCVIIILHCEESHRAFVAHMDSCTDIDLAEVSVALSEMKSVQPPPTHTQHPFPSAPVCLCPAPSTTCFQSIKAVYSASVHHTAAHLSLSICFRRESSGCYGMCFRRVMCLCMVYPTP